MILKRIESEKASANDFEGAVGSVRKVVIDTFPERVSEIRFYARAWGHWLGDDPNNDKNGFFDRVISDGQDFLIGCFRQLDLQKTEMKCASGYPALQ